MKILEQINNPCIIVDYDGDENLPCQFAFPEKIGAYFWRLKHLTMDKGLAVYERMNKKVG